MTYHTRHRCPKDRLELASNESMRLLYYSCQHCQGMWIPARMAPKIFWVERFAALDFADAVAHRDCAVCEAPLTAMQRSEVLIYRCEQCRGIWLDYEELKKIASCLDSEIEVPDVTARYDLDLEDLLVIGAAEALAAVITGS